MRRPPGNAEISKLSPEFEALLFSDIEALAATDPDWSAAAADLESIKAGVPSPEHIDAGAQTHPPTLLSALLRPRFRKVLHGPRIAGRIGLTRIRAGCRHLRCCGG